MTSRPPVSSIGSPGTRLGVTWDFARVGPHSLATCALARSGTIWARSSVWAQLIGARMAVVEAITTLMGDETNNLGAWLASLGSPATPAR
jgi:hypothetical protein